MASLKTQLTFTCKSSCTKFVVNHWRLNAANAEVVCKECPSLFIDHDPNSVTEEDVAMFLAHQEAKLGANCIIDEQGLGQVWLGGRTASIEPFVKEHHISAVVNASDLHTIPRRDFQTWAKKVEELEKGGLLTVMRLGWADEITTKLYREKPWDQLEQSIHFIHQYRVAGKNVVVHCAQGKSRSATVVIAYLMVVKNLTYLDALKIVQQKRPIALPNQGFEGQLKEFEKSTVVVELRSRLNK